MQVLNSTQKVLVLLVLVLAFVFRIFNISNHSIWEDEKVSVLIANGIKYNDNPEAKNTFTLQELKEKNTTENVLASAIKDNGNSIVYNFLLHYWCKAFGSSDFAIRFLSLIFSLVALLMAFFLCLKNSNFRIAFLVLLLLTVHALSVNYADQARNYSMTLFFTLCATYIFWNTLVKGESKWSSVLWYGLFCGLCILSHYLSAYVFIAHALIALLYLRGAKQWIHFIAGGCLAIAMVAVWMVLGGAEGLEILSHQSAVYVEMAKNYQPGDDSFVVPNTPVNMFMGLIQVWLQQFGNGLQAIFRIREIIPFLILPFFLIFYALRNEKEKRKFLFAALIIVLTQNAFATYLAMSSGHTISYQPLYSIFASPYAIIAMAFGFALLLEKNKKLAYPLISIQIIIGFISIYGLYLDEPKHRESNPYMAFSEKIEASNEVSSTIVCPTVGDAQLLSLYLSGEKNYTFKLDPQAGDTIKNRTLAEDFKGKRY
ncbi:MAG: glycosyltransferase family 39 protein [Flavobacteriales bacterium]